MADLGPTTESDPVYDRFARLVHAYLGVPVALVTFVGADGQRFPGAVGLPEPWQSLRGTPLSHSFCQHVVAQDRPLVVSDARTVDLLRDNLAIPDLDVIAYAGYPLRDLQGRAVGSLCAIDGTPREWTPDQLAVLEDLALACASEVQLREAAALAADAVRTADRRAEHGQVLLAMSDAFTQTLTPDEVLDAVQRVATEVAGAARASIGIVHPERGALTWARHAAVPGAPVTLWDDEPLSRAESPAVQVVMSGRPLFFDDATTMSEAFPIVAGVGGPGAAAFLPLTTSTATLGGVLLRWHEPRVVDDELRDLLVTLASDASIALERAQLLQRRRDVAHTLQSAMLSHLPSPAGVTLDAVYLPAEVTEQVGGDWYDAMELPDGGFALVVGDVTGHDMRAATRMGQLRSMLRTLLWEHDRPPSRILELLDGINTGTGLEAMATVLLARVEPPTDDGVRTLTWSCAGHPPALLHRAADGTVELAGRPDLPIGFMPDRERHDHEVRLAPGDTLVLYTDGLLERRTESLRTSIDAAARRLAVLPDLGARSLVDALGPTGDRRDDVVVLTLCLGPR
ncbi:SpoIIE family protein phosphatase [Cellulomonas sp. DKR-3]|uniref:SpoIIE family protein phosphatase n=1 Tax=Cellulomonas fulva TaxID=2835530 RepID=A0ABS5TXA9_9CELL|nr:SpoIIE family protein phosphatase [Cellulomonas fulva]MBT0993775.1 SpoIIE family protein phosphatase [Cellulomonas fulva]